MVRCPGFKFHATAAFLLFCFTTLKSQYSNHTCITLGIIVSCSGIIGETDATLKVVSSRVLSTAWTQDYKYCCVLQQIKALEAEIEELKRQLSQKKSKTSEYTCCTEESQITVFTDNIIQDLYQIESFHKFGTIRLATRRPVSPYDL